MRQVGANLVSDHIIGDQQPVAEHQAAGAAGGDALVMGADQEGRPLLPVHLAHQIQHAVG
ncbi:hypothetical protein D3C75_1286820 [compost metagenome]